MSSTEYTETATSLSEVCIKVVEYAEKHASSKRYLDPEKCVVEICKAVKSNNEKDSKLRQLPGSPTTIMIPTPTSQTKKSTDMVIKRRVYDVLHVLENVGVTRRISPDRMSGYTWNGLKALSDGILSWKGMTKQQGIKYETSLRHTKVPILSTIAHMFLRVCVNKASRSLTLKSAAAEIFGELLERIAREKANKIPTEKGVERRLYDVVSVLSSVGIIVRSRKEIFIPDTVLNQDTCAKHAVETMNGANKNQHKRRKPRTSEEVALEKYLRALKKGLSPSPQEICGGAVLPQSLALKIQAIKTPLAKQFTGKRKNNKITTIARPAKKSKLVVSSSQKENALSPLKFLPPDRAGPKVALAFGEAKKVGVHLDDLRLFCAAMATEID